MVSRAFRYLFIAVLCLLTASCAAISGKPKIVKADHTRQFILHVDDNFTEQERKPILDSFYEWQRDTYGIVSFEISKEKWNSKIQDFDFAVDDDTGCTSDVFVTKLSSNDKIVKEIEGNAPGNTLGFTMKSCDTKVVAFIMDRIHRMPQKDSLRFVGIHEAGHLIGLAHIPVPHESIMFPSADMAARCPSKLDMKELCMIYGCKWQDMKYCD